MLAEEDPTFCPFSSASRVPLDDREHEHGWIMADYIEVAVLQTKGAFSISGKDWSRRNEREWCEIREPLWGKRRNESDRPRSLR